MPSTTRRRTLTALTALPITAGLTLLATPAHAAPARPAHAATTFADCFFSDGSAGEIRADWEDGGRTVFEQVYRIRWGGADLEVIKNRKGGAHGYGGFPVQWYVSADGPLDVEIWNGGGAVCERKLS